MKTTVYEQFQNVMKVGPDLSKQQCTWLTVQFTDVHSRVPNLIKHQTAGVEPWLQRVLEHSDRLKLLSVVNSIFRVLSG